MPIVHAEEALTRWAQTNHAVMLLSAQGVLYDPSQSTAQIPAAQVFAYCRANPAVSILAALESKTHTSLYIRWQGEEAPDSLLPVDEATTSLCWLSLRAALAVLSEQEAGCLLASLQSFRFDQTHQYCHQCGRPLSLVAGVDPLEKICRDCPVHVYPNLPPAVMVLVQRGDSVLLAQGVDFQMPVYSALAGFIGPGETAEAAAQREVMEEVGLVIDHLRYRGTQSWPVSGAFMIAFVADYVSGDLRIDHREIVTANWFPKSNLPEIVKPYSIAHRLIHSVCAAPVG